MPRIRLSESGLQVVQFYWSTVGHRKDREWVGQCRTGREQGGPAVCAVYWLALGVEADPALSLS